MKKYIEYSKTIGIMLVSFLISYLVITILSYFNIINNISILEIIINIIIMFIGGYLSGIKTKNKGWLEGLKIGTIYVTSLFILNLFFIRAFSFKLILYYIILITSSIVGGMIGILKNKV